MFVRFLSQKDAKDGDQKQIDDQNDEASLHLRRAAGEQDISRKFCPVQMRIILRQRHAAKDDRADAVPDKMASASGPAGTAYIPAQRSSEGSSSPHSRPAPAPPQMHPRAERMTAPSSAAAPAAV